MSGDPTLTEQFHVPPEYNDVCDRLTTLVRQHTRRLLAEEFWTDDHLQGFQNHSGAKDYTYARDRDVDLFADVEMYLYDRFKRCVYKRVVQVLGAHADEFQAFQFVTDTVEERKIRAIGWERLRTRLFEADDSPYIEWGILESVVEQLNDYFDRHGRFPDTYTDLVDVPDPNGALPYSPDSRGDIHEIDVENGHLRIELSVPESLAPEDVTGWGDWEDEGFRVPLHDRFHRLLEAGTLKPPTLHGAEHGYTLDVPVEIDSQRLPTSENRVLSVDLGVKKQATCMPLEAGNDDGDDHRQIAPPTFLDHHAKGKLVRLKADAEGINDRLAELRRQGKAHTERFDHLLAEYRRTRRKERRLRGQLQHDVANQLIWTALSHDCSTLVFESLGDLQNDASGRTAWSISTWARGDLLTKVEYKAGLLGIEVETVNPWGTSRYCPRCGDRGETVKAPTDHTECRNGGHFHCPACGYECDRDVVGAVNVGRKYLDQCKMETANPVAYMATGNHARFPSRADSTRDPENEARARSPGVQSATETGSASGRQIHLSQYRVGRPPDGTGGTDMGGLSPNRGRKTASRYASGSVTQYVLASTTDCG